MKFSIKLGLIIVILTIIRIAAGWYFYSKQAIYKEGSEENYDGREKDADMPPDLNNPSFLVRWTVSLVLTPVKSGKYSVELYLDGRQD